MIMKKIFVIAVLALFASAAFAQNPELAIDFTRYGSPVTGPGYIDRSVVYDLIHEIEKVNRSKSPEELNELFLNSIEGTPYLNSDFEKGEIETIDGQMIGGAMIRYNVYNDKMEVLQNEVLFEVSDELTKQVRFGGWTFDYLPYRISKKQGKGYLELVADGDLNLYCRYSKKFKDAQPQKAMQDRPNPPQFRDLPEVYLLMGKGLAEATGFKSKKELIGVFPGHHDAVRAYLKKNKLKHNDRDDLKRLLEFYDSL